MLALDGDEKNLLATEWAGFRFVFSGWRGAGCCERGTRLFVKNNFLLVWRGEPQ
jgi:hypothetical protein